MGKGVQRKGNREEGACATDASTAYKQGLKLYGDGVHGKALSLFDRAIAFRTDCPHYFFARANCLQAVGRHVDAYHDYVSAISLNRTKCTYFSCRGLCLIKMGKLDSALSDFSKACELEPTAAVHHYQRASLLHHRLARSGEAIGSYSECLANAGPGDAAMTLRCLHAKGACLFEEGRAAEAVADLSRAVEISDPSPASLHYLAKGLKAIGREKRALVVLGEALEKWELVEGTSSDCRSSSRHEAFFDRGVIRLNCGDDAGALSDFDKAVTLSRGARGEYFVQRARARARVAMRSNGREEAMAGVQDIEKAMELESHNPEFLFTAGVLCSRMGEYNRALGHLQLLLAFFKKQGDDMRDTAGKEGKDVVASLAACEFETALCLYKLRRPSDALHLAESALTAGRSMDARRFQLRGLILHDLGRYRDAVKDFTASLAVGGQRPEGLLLRGRSFAGLASHERAIGDFTTALVVIQPNGSDRRAKGGLGSGGGGTFLEASSDAECKEEREEERRDANSIVAKSGSPDGGGAIPNAMLNEGCAPGEKETCGIVDQEQPSSEENRDRERRGDDEACRKLSQEDTGRRGSQRGDGGDGMDEGVSVVGACHYARALSLQRQGNHADAAVDFDAAIAEGPISWQRLWHRATCLAELGEPHRASAARDLKECLSMAEREEPPPEAPNFLFQVGLAYLRLGDSVTALKHFDGAKKEQRSNPAATSFEDSSLHYHRGLCLMKAGELVKADDAFSLAIENRNRPSQREADKLALSRNPDSMEMMLIEYYRERGKVRQLLRDFDGARADFTACLDCPEQPPQNEVSIRIDSTVRCRLRSPQDAYTLFRRGWANKALGDLAAAAVDFEAARLLEPLHPHLSVDYRNIFGTELVVVDDDEHFTQAPAYFHSW